MAIKMSHVGAPVQRNAALCRAVLGRRPNVYEGNAAAQVPDRDRLSRRLQRTRLP